MDNKRSPLTLGLDGYYTFARPLLSPSVNHTHICIESELEDDAPGKVVYFIINRKDEALVESLSVIILRSASDCAVKFARRARE